MNTYQQFIDLSLQSMGIIPLLALMLLVVLAVTIERAAFFARIVPSGHALDRELAGVDHNQAEALRAIATRYETTVFGGTLRAAIDARHLEPEAMDRYVDEAIVRTLPQLDRSLWLLDAAVTLGPLIGLLGTIIGITESFNVLGTSGPNVGAVTGGIGHALIATGCGLAVAIVGVAANSYFSKRVRLATLQLDLVKLTCVKRLHLVEGQPTTHAAAQTSVERAPFKRALNAGLSGA
ncbi:MotA/TolQ/ExbB proton channel family protein (plasmid) [Ralstonia sp. 25C]|uniref:MotA/TolQ/ExbB proton channel family protein n=1 Tax=Ralstonia sp. 25C TaxID=3447363 RepID=UPI003F74ED6E